MFIILIDMGSVKYFKIKGKTIEFETMFVNISKARALRAKRDLKNMFGDQVLVHIVKAPKGSGTGFGMSRPDGYDVYTNPDERDLHKLKAKN